MSDKDEKKPPVQGEPVVVKHPDQPKKPIVQPDGHEVLSQADIDARS